jgi:chromosome segregation ATPase
MPTRITVIVQTTNDDLTKTIEEIKMQLSDLDTAIAALESAITDETVQADELADIKDGLPERVEQIQKLVEKVKGIVPDAPAPEPSA